MGPQWEEDICYRGPLNEISRLPSRPAPPTAAPAPIFPKRLQEDPSRRDSGMSTGSSEMEPAEPGEGAENQVQENDMAGWWEPRVKVNLADQLPGILVITIHMSMLVLIHCLLRLENTYLAIQPGRYLFPGAELFYDPDEEVESDSDSSDSSDSSGIDGGDPAMSFQEHGIKRKATD